MSVKERAKAALLEGAYELALSYYEKEDWPNAVKWLREIVEMAPTYKDAVSRLENAQKQLKLVVWYTQALEQRHNQDWAGAIETLNLIQDADPDYKEVNSLLAQMRQKEILEQEYQQALKRYATAEETEQESDWREAATLLKEIADKEPGYKLVDSKLEQVQRRLKFFELSQKGKEYYARGDWQEAIDHLERAIDLDFRESDLANSLDQAREKLRERETAKRRRGRVVAIMIAVLVVVLIIAAAIVPCNFIVIGNAIAQIVGRGTTSTPTTVIHDIARIEVFMNGSPIDPDRLPSLTRGEDVILEVFVVDTNGKTYTSDDLKCAWSVDPLGDKDIGINTDQCKTLYVPSQEHSSQTVVLKIGGPEQPSQPGNPISLNFTITQTLIAAVPTDTPTFTSTPSPTFTRSSTPTPTPGKPITTSLPISTPATSPPITTSTPTLTPTATAIPPPTFTPSPPALKLAYVVTKGSDHTLFLANLTNFEITNPALLVPLRAASPSWSPDGRRIVFLGEVGIEYTLTPSRGGGGIWIYDLAAQEPALLQEDDKAKHLVWSPDGKLIAYESAKDTGESRIFFLDAAGKHRPGNVRGEQPAWSPDSSRIIMKACKPGGCGIWTVDLDDLTPQRVTSHETDSFPDWWANQVIFTSQYEGNWDIYHLTVDEIGRPQDNLDPEQLTLDPAQDTTPVFSPDGRYIFFRSDRSGAWAIWVMNADGTDPRQLIETGGSDAWNLEKFSVVADSP